MQWFIAIILLLQSSLYERTVGFHNLALNGSAFQSGTYAEFDANRAKDGNNNQNFSFGSCSHTETDQVSAWWSLDIGQLATIHNVVIYYRSGRPDRLNGYFLYISKDFDSINPKGGHQCFHNDRDVHPDIIQNKTCDTVGRNVVIYQENVGIKDLKPILELCEVEVFGCYSGTYGTNCEHSCSQHCQDRTCNIRTGACTCEGKYQGQECSGKKPEVVTPDKIRYYLVNTDIEIKCTVRANPESTGFQWKKDGNNITFQHDRYRIVGNNLRILSTTMSDRGSYTCEAINALGIGNDTAELLPGEKPEVVTPDKIRYFLVNTNIEIKCTVRANPESTGFQWKKDGNNITFQHDRYRIVGNNLRILSTTMSDRGSYTCEAINALGIGSDTVELLPGDLPSIRVTQNSITALITSSITIQVQVPVVYPPVNDVFWSHNNRRIDYSMHWKFSDGNIATPSLTIKNVDVKADGTYLCYVSNVLGSVFETITLFTWDKPSIAVSESKIVAVGSSITLNCNVKSSKPSLKSLVWKKESVGSLLASMDVTKYQTLLHVIKNITKADAGRYVCIGSNGYANSTADTYIDVGDIPRINITRNSIAAQISTDATLQAVVPHVYPPVNGIYWLQNNIKIDPFITGKFSGGNIMTPSLTIKNVDYNDDGTYNIKISNILGSDIGQIKLFTYSIPLLVVSAEQFVAVGSSVTMQCEVKNSKPKVQTLVWKRESQGSTEAYVKVADITSINGVERLHFVKNNITKADAGHFICIAFNGYANSTAHTHIYVDENPSVLFPSDVFISKHQMNITLTCILNYVTKNANVFWEKSTDTFRWSRIYTDRQKYFGATLHKPELLVTNVQLEDAQTYKCCVRDTYGNACNTTVLKVLYVNTSTAKIVRRANITVELKCDAKGGKILTWRHNNGLLNTNRYIGGTIDNPTISMKNLSRADAGYYTCETSYDNVTVVSPSIYLDVLDIPHIVKHNTSIRGVPGDLIDLLCRHESNPKPTSVFWTKNGEKIQLNSTTNKFNGSSLLNPSLTILNADAGDSGTYMCVMTNSIGTGYGENITLIVQDKGQLGNTVSLIVGIIAAVIVAGLVLLAVFVLRRRQSNRQKETSQLNQSINSNTQYVNVPLATDYKNELYTNSDSTSTFTKDSVAPPVIQPEATNQSDSEYYNMSDVTKMVKVEALKQYIDRREIKDELRKEYKNMSYGAKLPTKQAQLKDNMPKNRFKTTFPYDHSRVILEVLDGVDNSDYINANFIDGFRKDKCYIASQGPTKLTLFDHWRMIWQYNVRRIVMLTNLIEGTKVKCELYWPKETRMSCGHFALTLVSEKQRATYITREIVAENTKTKENRTIMQYHFISWPDHGTPDPLYLVLFHVHVTMDQFKDESGPLLVHCSAGIGRTGTYIALDSLCKEGLATGNVNFVKCVERMRQSRMNMIQTADQYVCLHYTLLEALAMTNTNIRKEQFFQIWHEINDDITSNKKQKLHKEFMILTKKKSEKDHSNYRAAKSPENIGKNRNHDVVPADSCRVFLVSHTTDRSDYINAVQVPSYTKLNGFLVTQLPLPDTKIDFWTMIHDHTSATIVLLFNDAEEANMIYTQEDDSFEIGRFHIKVVAKESEIQNLTTLTLNVSTKNTKPRDVLVYQAVCNGIPESTLLCRLVDLITATVRTSDNPITVVSSDGAKNCGLLCTFANAISSITMDGSADIFNLSRVIQFKQPEFFANFEEYKRCYEALGVYLESSNVYANL